MLCDHFLVGKDYIVARQSTIQLGKTGFQLIKIKGAIDFQQKYLEPNLRGFQNLRGFS